LNSQSAANISGYSYLAFGGNARLLLQMSHIVLTLALRSLLYKKKAWKSWKILEDIGNSANRTFGSRCVIRIMVPYDFSKRRYGKSYFRTVRT